MRNALISLACGLAAVASMPALADTTADDQMLVRLTNGNTDTLPQCAKIGFTFDHGGLDTAAKAAAQHLTSQQMMQAIGDSMADIKARPAPPALAPAGSTTVVRLRALMASYADLQTRCDQLADNPVMARYLKREGYQAQPGDKSLFTRLLYLAQGGDAAAQASVGEFYASGIEPDPDHSLAVGWFRRGAEGGSPFGAARLADATAAGIGTPKDMVAADMWAIVAETRGQHPGRVARIEAGLSPSDVAEAHTRAEAWLSSHPVAQ